MEIQLSDFDREKYLNACTQILKEQFAVGIYSDDESIVKAYKICLDFYVSEFERESLFFDSLIDVIDVITMYSTIRLDYNGKSQPNTIIIASKMLRYLMGELTKMDIKSDKKCSVNDYNISRLWHLTHLIAELIQKIYTYFINNNKAFSFELLEDGFDFTISDTKFAEIINEVAKKSKTTKIGGFQFHPEDPLIDFFEIADQAFGEEIVFDLLSLINQNCSSTIIDCDQISEKDFIDILSGRNNFSPTPKLWNEISELSALYAKYSNSLFLDGLTLRGVDVNLTRNITHPHSNYARTRFRPILELTVDNTKKYFTTRFMFNEAMNEHVTNQIPFDILPQEWINVKSLRDYAKQQDKKHAAWIEGYLEGILKKLDLSYLRNKESINGKNLDKEPAENGECVGEIDFIVVNNERRKLYVIECKCLKSYYDFPSFSLDKEKFEGTNKKGSHKKKLYNNQLRYKFDWVSKHMKDVRAELEKNNVSLLNDPYTVDCLFLTDTKSYYSFFSKHKMFSKEEIEDYLLNN